MEYLMRNNLLNPTTSNGPYRHDTEKAPAYYLGESIVYSPSPVLSLTWWQVRWVKCLVFSIEGPTCEMHLYRAILIWGDRGMAEGCS